MPPARRAKRTRAQTYEELSLSEDEADYKPAAKKVKRVRGKRGNLASFLSMPLDVIYEVGFFSPSMFVVVRLIAARSCCV